MLKILLFIIFSPLLLVFYFGYCMFYIVGYTFYLLIKLFMLIISFILNICGIKRNVRPISFPKVNFSNKKRNTKHQSYSEFDRESELWGLSEEDKKIAKQERMSPAEFIEAEERDDDVLDTDEWK